MRLCDTMETRLCVVTIRTGSCDVTSTKAMSRTVSLSLEDGQSRSAVARAAQPVKSGDTHSRVWEYSKGEVKSDD